MMEKTELASLQEELYIILSKMSTAKAFKQGDKVVIVSPKLLNRYGVGEHMERVLYYSDDRGDGSSRMVTQPPGEVSFNADVVQVNNLFIFSLKAYEDALSTLLDRRGEMIWPPRPSFKVDQIVYVVPNKNKAASVSYPAIASQYETALKIISFEPSPLNSCILYTMYPGNSTGKVVLPEQYLVSVLFKNKYLYPEFKAGIVNTDLSPFFHVNEEVAISDGVVRNISDSVQVPYTAELKPYITIIK